MIWKIDLFDFAQGKIVIPEGEIDMENSGELREHLQNLVQQNIILIVVSLENVSHIDSSGLATLIECFQQTAKYGGEMRLVIDNPKILDVFKLARLDKILKIYPDRDSAGQS